MFIITYDAHNLPALSCDDNDTIKDLRNWLYTQTGDTLWDKLEVAVLMHGIKRTIKTFTIEPGQHAGILESGLPCDSCRIRTLVTDQTRSRRIHVAIVLENDGSIQEPGMIEVYYKPVNERYTHKYNMPFEVHGPNHFAVCTKGYYNAYFPNSYWDKNLKIPNLNDDPAKYNYWAELSAMLCTCGCEYLEEDNVFRTEDMYELIQTMRKEGYDMIWRVDMFENGGIIGG